MKDDLYTKGYYDAIADVEKAAKIAEHFILGPEGEVSFNDWAVMLEELRKLKAKRLL